MLQGTWGYGRGNTGDTAGDTSDKLQGLFVR